MPKASPPIDPADPAVEVEKLRAENAELKTKLLNNELPPELDVLVKDKVAKGLTRDQAIAVARAQLAHDKALAETAATTKK